MASVWNRAPAACAAAASSRMGCTTPVSLLAIIMLTSATSLPSSSVSAAGSMYPARHGCTRSTVKPAARSSGRLSRMESCSMADTITRSRLRSRWRAPSARPSNANWLASVPPLVRMISDGRTRAPKLRAISRRATSRRAAALRPSECREFGLTPASSLSSYSRCARRASARMGVEAA